MTSIFFTALSYEVSYLEFFAAIASFIGVGLGVTGKRITWPWWGLSSALYLILFINWDLFASAILQLVFIVAAIMGWFGWGPSGAKPGPFKNKYRLATIAAILIATLAFAPILKNIGAAAAFPDALLLFGSISAQLLMVYEKYDSWPLWLAVDAGYVALYTSQGLHFTALLYLAFTVIAAIGWKSWYGSHRRAVGSL